MSKKHFLEEIKERYPMYKDTTFVSSQEEFKRFIQQQCPNFVHKGPREFPALVEVVFQKDDQRPIIGYTYSEHVQKYIFDKKLS